jgi:hypothetical protein
MVSTCESVDVTAELGLHRVRNAAAPLDDVDDSIAELEHTARQNNLAAAVRVVQRMVPEFHPSETLMALVDSHQPRLIRA